MHLVITYERNLSVQLKLSTWSFLHLCHDKLAFAHGGEQDQTAGDSLDVNS